MIKLNLHRQIMLQVLREIYSDVKLRKVMGFKGGTAAMFFYQLPRMSVDLDFDLLDYATEQIVFKRLQKILPQFGELKDASQKHYTLFFLLRYQKYQRNLKIEISRRAHQANYQVKDFLGLSMRVMAQDDMTAYKLSALLTRKTEAARDFFDVWFFLKNDWPINQVTLKQETGLSLAQVLEKAIIQTKNLEQQTLLHSLGELVSEKQKQWLKNKFKNELLFQLRLKLEVGCGGD